jgi:type IV pilus assembly protein PilB
MRRKRLGDALQRRGKISAEAIEGIVRQQTGSSGLLGEMLLKRGLISKSDLIGALEELHGVPYLEANLAEVQADALQLIPYALAERFVALPVCQKKNKLVVLMEQPGNLEALQQLSFASGRHIEARFGFGSEILEAVRKYYEANDLDSQRETDTSIEFVTATSSQRNLQAIRDFQTNLREQPTPAVEAVSSIMTAAIAKKASDIHIDPQPQGAIVRIRVDGILRELQQIPLRLQDAVASRIKILADMDIAERRAPQDGRIHISIGAEKRDLRVSTLPTQYGEKLVIRLLDVRSALAGFQDLGLWQEHSDLLSDMLTAPQGMILVTGPTGSGKTTTLYAALNFLRSRTLNIITVEDPVEYRLEGVNQVQVHEKAGRTFAASLRSILRQDPNVIMLGEIRDGETAEIALRAAQTGHLVLSTMHTRDSTSAIARLLDLGVAPFLIASSVTAVIAQRLVRKLCECRIEAAASPAYAALMETAGISSQNRMYIPGGCPACDSSGYNGRVGIYEMLVMDDFLTELVRSGAGLLEITRAAIDKGMRTMEDDALLKISMGFTSLEEVKRVVTFKGQSAGNVQNKFQDLARRV